MDQLQHVTGDRGPVAFPIARITAICEPDAWTIRETLVASGSSGGETQLFEETPYQPIRPSATAPSR